MTVVDAPRPATHVDDLDIALLCFVDAHEKAVGAPVSRTTLHQYVRAAVGANPYAEWVPGLLRGGMADRLAAAVARLLRHQLVRVSSQGYVLADGGRRAIEAASESDVGDFELRVKYVDYAVAAVRSEVEAATAPG